MAIPGSLQRKPFWAPIGVAAASALAAAFLMALLAWLLITARSTTIIVVRHAETAQNGTADPPLSPQGRARADLLARMFGDSQLKEHVDVLYTSPDLRSRATAQPLADRLGLTPLITRQDDPRALARRMLHDHRGERILVVGHSDTLRELVAALSGVKDIAPILPTQYGTMYLVTVPRVGRASLLSVNY